MTRAGPVVYVAFDSLSEGVGSSQVLAYVERLPARGVDVVVHSFESNVDAIPALAVRLETAGVTWHPHRFGSAGPLGGLGRVLRAAWFARRGKLVHGRSDLPALAASLHRGRPFIWDMRAFWLDERIAVGSVRRRSFTARILRANERRLARRASGIIVLARVAAVEVGRRYGREAETRTTVIPTCVDLSRFQSSPMPESPVIRILIAGSLNERYDLETMFALADAIRTRTPAVVDVVSPRPFHGLLAKRGATVRAAQPDEMPGIIAEAHVGFSVRRDGEATRAAAMPTKIGEFLACGRPVVVSAKLGDMNQIVAKHRCGVVLRSSSAPDIAAAADELIHLLSDPELPDRCRAAAEGEFDLEHGVDRLVELYEGVWRTD